MSKTSAKGEPVELSNRPPTAANVKWPIFLGKDNRRQRKMANLSRVK